MMNSNETALTPQQVIRRRAFGEPVLPGEAPSESRHTIALRLESSIGALNRVVNLFSARGFDLESVAVGETEDASVARMTLVTSGNDRIIAQVLRQLERLVDVLEVDDLSHANHVERELCLVNVRYTANSRAELLDTLEIFRGKVVDVTTNSMMFELTGPTQKIDAFIELVRPHGILELARSGRVAMRRGSSHQAAA
jgi:acetolactate synthase I/III small subunit